jgi:putative hydrolase of the HAD superfamily
MRHASSHPDPSPRSVSTTVPPVSDTNGRGTAYRAVIFDLGGVVFPSPFDVFDAYEREVGLPDRFIRTVVAASAEDGAWARFERSEVSFADFCTALEAECAAAGGTIDAAALMQGIGAGFAPRPEMMRAIRRLRDAGLRVGALTNNWARPDSGTLREPVDLGFDIVVESAVEGIRKPDPRIYALVCERLAVTPDACVFLDDLGVNLKPARAMGMTTIKVIDPVDALVELGGHLDLELVGA